MMASPNSQRQIVDAPALVRRVILPDQVQGYDVDPAIEMPELFEALVSLSDTAHARIQVAPTEGSGSYEFCGFSDGFFMSVGDMELPAPHHMSVTAPDMLRIRITREGDVEYGPPRGARLSLKGPNTSIIIEPAGQPAADAVIVGSNRYVQIFIHRGALQTLFDDVESELPTVLQAFLAGSLLRTVARTLPLSAVLLRCLEDIHTCTLEGLRRRLFLQSKAIEISCHAFEALTHEDEIGTSDSSALTVRGVLKAQRLLMENFIAPPSLVDLAREVGLSRSGLCAGFRQVLGQSVFDYIQDLRMQKALALLSERDTSVTQIAYAIGYNHVSSFTVAVQRHFGASPRELRRRNGLV